MADLQQVKVPLPLKNMEKGTRYVVGALLAGAGIAGGYYLFPILAQVFKSGVIALGWMITLGVGAVVTFLGAKVLKELWPYLIHLTKVTSLKISEQMIKRDAGPWLKIYIEEHDRQRVEMLNGENLARKGLNTTNRQLEKLREEMTQASEMAKAAFQKGQRALAIQQNRMAERRARSIKWGERRQQMLEFITRALKRMREALEITLADEKDQLNSIIQEAEMAEAVDPAIKASFRAMNQDKDQLRIKEIAMNELMSRADTTYAELENVINIFQPIIAEQDLEDDVAMERMAKEFAKVEGQLDSMIFGPEGKQQLLSEGTPDFKGLLAPVKEQVPVRADATKPGFGNLIDRK